MSKIVISKLSLFWGFASYMDSDYIHMSSNKL